MPLAFLYGARELLWKGGAMLPFLDDGGPIARTLARYAAQIKARAGWSLDETLSVGSEKMPDDRIELTVGAVQMALTEGWRQRGIVPQAICGRSAGELAARCAQGYLSMESQVELQVRWARLVPQLRGTAVTLALEAGLARSEELRRASPAEFFIIADVTDALTLVACAPGAAPRVREYLRAQGVTHGPTTLNYGPHSPLVEHCASAYLDPPVKTSTPDPGIAYYSAGQQAADTGQESYALRMWRGVRAPTRMGLTLQRMIEDGYDVFIEIGGRTTLDEPIRARADTLGRRVVLLPTMRPGQPAQAVMDQTQAALLALGIAPR